MYNNEIMSKKKEKEKWEGKKISNTPPKVVEQNAQ